MLKTHIVYRTNINSKLVAKYLEALTESGLLCVQETESGAPVYKTTERGGLFIRSYESLRTVFDHDTRLIFASQLEKQLRPRTE